MKEKNIDSILRAYYQRELNASELYAEIAKTTKSESEKKTLEAIAADEREHASVFSKLCGQTMQPDRRWVRLHLLARRLFGYTFLIKQLESSEDADIRDYREELARIPNLQKVLDDEERHEKMLMGILDEERLHYIGDIILGMNDALVELTGALAGYTLAMQNTKTIAMAGMITGVSATLSMAASGYLSAREEKQKSAFKSTMTIGLAYLITVALLIIPYLLFPAGGYIGALIVTLVIAILIIAGFNYYLSVAKERSFRRGFNTMALISLSVAAISFVVGFLVKNVLGITM
jgi:VIT1/CCC1 family predicted Fe2+/Mn2+ transporter